MKNNKIISIVISVCIMFCSFTLVSFADAWDGTTKTEPLQNEDGAYVITSAAELAWFADNAGENDAILEDDIDLADNEWTPICYYYGRFDGNGHTISGLKINSSDECTGLFSYIEGTISNLTVTGAVNFTGYGYSDSFTGGIAAYNAGVIENCIADITVTTTGSSNYAGGITGYNYGTITGCLNKGNITSATGNGMGGIAGDNYDGIITLSANYGNILNTYSYGYYAGGIVGRVEGSGSKIDSVYNTGNVTCYNNVGGIAGQVSALDSITNCYSSGNVTCTSSSSYAYYGGITSYGYSSNPISKMSNCYFLKTDTINASLSAVQTSNTDTVCSVTEQELKSSEFISSLGGAFDADTANINNGYPILKWQNTNASYKAVIAVSPQSAVLTLINGNNEEISGSYEYGVYTFDNIAKGDYTYTVSCSDGDYKSESGSFTIADTDYYNTVILPLNTYTVSFEIEPDYADFTLKSGDIVLSPVSYENGVYEYSLPEGGYTYSASAFGFNEETDSIIIGRADSKKSITLDKLPSSKISFSLTDKTNGAVLDNLRTEIKSGDYVISSEADASYLLPVGTYTYTVICSGYTKCTGEFDIIQNDIDTGEKNISLETEPSAAWDGDMDEPVYSDGKWQIANGNELAWFAGYVNGTQSTQISGASYDAVLINDIDLSGELNWTPIGLSNYGNEYSGTFDGNDYTISGLYINTNKTYQGLFGKNTEKSVIKNLTVEGELRSTSTDSYSYIGGVCGYNSGQILNCINKVNVISDGGCVGGICGYSAGSSTSTAVISQCANYGTVSYENGTGQYKGGITGRAQVTNISECSNSGYIKGNGIYTGGISGYLLSSSKLTDCYNTGSINSNASSFGGITGGTYLSSYGDYGLVNCYNASEVNALSSTCQNYGALIGYYDGGNVTNCYCLIEENGINAIGKVSYGTTPTVTIKASADEICGIFEDLNTNSVWAENSKLNNGYPILLWQNAFAQYSVIFTLNPNTANIELSLNDNIIAPVKAENGIYEYSLKSGSYNYTVSADGFYSKSDEINVGSEDVNVEISLTELPKPTETPTVTETPKATTTPKKLVKIDGEELNTDNVAITSGLHSIEADYSVIGDDIENGLLILAVYDSNGALKQVFLADETYTVSTEYDIPDKSVIKIFFWEKNSFKPECATVEIIALS